MDLDLPLIRAGVVRPIPHRPTSAAKDAGRIALDAGGRRPHRPRRRGVSPMDLDLPLIRAGVVGPIPHRPMSAADDAGRIALDAGE